MQYMKQLIILGMILFGFFFGVKKVDSELTGKEPVQKIIEKLGGENSPNMPNKVLPGASIEIGENLVKYGKAKHLGGGLTRRQSKHFVCTSCHNIEKESAYLNLVDPQERLEYVSEKSMPFLQGSPLFGIVNRTSFYNDDYEKKYGDLVLKARNNIREAIQLCAVECSQGRQLDDWEIESILMYLWTIDIKLDDLIFDEADLNLLQNAIKTGEGKPEALAMLRSKYLPTSPAHFTDPPVERKKNVDGESSDVKNGQLIYDQACLHCHERNDYSYYRLNHEKLSFQQLKNRMKYYDERSFYQVIRYGTKPKYGKKAYMPQYTIEKMSVKQLEDLRAYIIQESE